MSDASTSRLIITSLLTRFYIYGRKTFRLLQEKLDLLAMPSRTRPIEKFAQAVAKCSAEVKPLIPMTKASILRDPQASVYGKCIVADYNSVHKDKCLTEFLRLKDCYMVRSSKSYPWRLLTRSQAAAKKS
jgi:NADH dehydrogenase [ubiquinone] 1 alpha subcomplex assembly factor 8